MLIPTVTRSVCMGQKPEHLYPWQEASGLSAGSEHPIKIQLPKFGEVLMGLPPPLSVQSHHSSLPGAGLCLSILDSQSR